MPQQIIDLSEKLLLRTILTQEIAVLNYPNSPLKFSEKPHSPVPVSGLFRLRSTRRVEVDGRLGGGGPVVTTLHIFIGSLFSLSWKPHYLLCFECGPTHTLWRKTRLSTAVVVRSSVYRNICTEFGLLSHPPLSFLVIIGDTPLWYI
ncbi:hypothetical protein CDAR_105371 [Caerostris darwini]|uniref:Cytochrome c biogenesis B n=1 Tax=Caerostris darwini TaxID=1538125 RepID=A0AAV4SJX6_9ARAC|nr:hypothetical protein CDAR_105371 [Caerostris darwini]